MKKKLIITLAILTFIAVVVFPFINTGINVETTPKNAKIKIDGEEVPGRFRLPSDNYLIEVSSPGYKTVKERIKVGIYGKTKLKYQLEKKSLIKEVPYYPQKEFYWIEGSLKDDLPYYEIHYADTEGKALAEEWLNKKGLVLSEENIIYIQDGD